MTLRVGSTAEQTFNAVERVQVRSIIYRLRVGPVAMLIMLGLLMQCVHNYGCQGSRQQAT
jgi:hypothetical protein